ncbi:hypothetical protein [Gordonia sp. SL306]|uniref:hypothetical protein n=1 Tax=Gordonia sp. SL306 TaxID=2995145 RepID=UPI00227218BF|nr:hypothetical protein [Gordonia sp. SL306]WAC55616.1 hypothetical protein OVA31_24095 [Gordonia sp. SL306]
MTATAVSATAAVSEETGHGQTELLGDRCSRRFHRRTQRRPLMDLDEIVDELYGLPPAEFVARRNVLAKEAKGAGRTRLAAEVAALRRPTRVAWAVNQWARHDPDGVGAILDLAAELAAAQRRAAADRLRDLSVRRQRLIAETVVAVAERARELDAALSDNAIREVGQSLRAALADPEVGAELQRGRLVTAAEYSGFGPAGVFAVPEPVADVSDQDTDDHPDNDPAAEAEKSDDLDERIAAAAAALRSAEADEHRAREDVAQRADQRAEAARRADELAEQAERLRAELAHCDAELRFARRQLTVADDEGQSAAQALSEVQTRVDKARRILAGLEGR